MRIARSITDIEVYGGHVLEKGIDYVMAGSVLGQLKKIFPGGIVEVGSFDDYYRKLDVPSLKEGDSVFLFRSGGIGDVMFMLPLIKFLKETFKVKIGAASSPNYIIIFEDNPYIDEVVKIPFELNTLKEYDYHLMFEGVIEDKNERAERFHAVDLFLAEGGIDPKSLSNKDKVPHLYLSEKRKIRAENQLNVLIDKKDRDRKKIGIQIESSSPIRTFPLDKMVQIIFELLAKDYSIFLFGGKSQAQKDNYLRSLIKNKNLKSFITPGISLLDSIGLVSQMDVILAPDSAFIHIAGGLGVPIVGLYGCFPSLLRMRYYTNAIGIDCNVPCAPSFIHGHFSCSKGNPSPCFSVISVENVIDAVGCLLGEFDMDLEYPALNKFKDGELIESGI